MSFIRNVFVLLPILSMSCFLMCSAHAEEVTTKSEESIVEVKADDAEINTVEAVPMTEEDAKAQVRKAHAEAFKKKLTPEAQARLKEAEKEEAEFAALKEKAESQGDPVDAELDESAETVSIGTENISLYEFKKKLKQFGDASFFRGGEHEIVLCIEDVAGSFENQKVISDFIEAVLNLQKGIPITKTVVSERKVHDFAGMVSFPDKEMLSYLRDYVLKQNMISGAEHFFIDNLSDTFLFSIYDEEYNIKLYKYLKNLHDQREDFNALVDDFKRWVEDIEAYIVLETNLSDYRKSELSTLFKRYYKVIKFIRSYGMIESSVEEMLDYTERKANYYSLAKIVTDIDDALSSMSINVPTDYNVKEINTYLRSAEHVYSTVLHYKLNLVADFMKLVKSRNDKFSIFVVEAGFSDIVRKELKRRSISYIWFESAFKDGNAPKAESMMLPAANKFEKTMTRFLNSWKDRDTVLKSDFFGKRSRSFVALTSVFHYLFLRMNKLKDSFRHDLYKAAHLIEKDKEAIIAGIMKLLDKRLREKKMFKTQKDYLTIKEMNEVNMEVSRKINELKQIFSRLVIEYDKIMINKENQMRIPFLMEMRGEDVKLVFVLGKDVKAEIKDVTFLLQKGILDEEKGLSYKLMIDSGVSFEDDYRLIGRMFDNKSALEKISNTLKAIEDDTASSLKEKELFSEAEQKRMLEDTSDISNRIGKAEIQTVIFNFDEVYRKAAEAVRSVFKLYDKLNLSLKEVMRLAETLNTKNRKTFIFYLDRETRVELGKELSSLYAADRFSESLDYRISEFIRGIDIAFTQADMRLVLFRTKALRNIIKDYDSIFELKKIFYLTLFSQPFFKMDRDKLIKRKNVVGLFDHLRTRLIVLDMIFEHKKLTVDDAEFFAGFIVDSFFTRWKELKRKEHREIFGWEKEDLLDFERLLMRAALVQFKVDIIRAEFAKRGEDAGIHNYKQAVLNSKTLSEVDDYTLINRKAEEEQNQLVPISFLKATLWKKLFMPKPSFYDFSRFALKKKRLVTRWKDLVSFDSLFKHESITSFWYENLGNTDILSSIYTGLVINLRDLIKVKDNLYIFESASFPYRFLISFTDEQKVDKLYIEKITKSQTEAVFLPFLGELVDNRFDRKVVADIYDKVRFVLEDEGVLDKITREISDMLLFEPVLKAASGEEAVKTAVKYDHLLSYVTHNCMKMEKKAPRELSLGRGVYIMRNYDNVRERMDRIYHFVSNSFLIRRGSTDVFDSIMHEMVHYWFYLFSFAEKKDETWIRGPYLFFNVPDKFERFFDEFALIDGLDINMEKRNYFKVPPEKLIEYRKAEELIAMLIETVFQEKTVLNVDLLDGRRMSFPLMTEDIQVLVWNNMLPFWMSPQNIDYDKPQITAEYYDKVFAAYTDILKKNDKNERLINFLDYSKDTLTLNVIDRRSLAFANGYLFAGEKDKAYNIVMSDVESLLKQYFRDGTLSRAEYRTFRDVLHLNIRSMSPENVILLLKNFKKYFNQVQEFYYLVDTDSELSQQIVYKYIVSYFVRNSFTLPKLTIVKSIDYDTSVFIDKYFHGNNFSHVADIYEYFKIKRAGKAYIGDVLTRYLCFNFITGSLKKAFSDKLYANAASVMKTYKCFYLKKEIDLLKNKYFVFNADSVDIRLEKKLFMLFFCYEKALFSQKNS